MEGDYEDTEASPMSEDGDLEHNWDDDDDDGDGDGHGDDDNWDDVAVNYDGDKDDGVNNWDKDVAGVNNWDNDHAVVNNNWGGGNGVYEEVEEPRYFEQSYICYPISHIGKSEEGNRIIMPQSALDHLASLKIQFPMIFKIKSHFHSEGEPISHCGVLEFTAEEGFVFMPSWMMKNLDLEKNELVKLKSSRLSKGTYLKLQPHKTEFILLQNPKDILEKALISFACLTKGDTIMISHNKNEYLFDVLETEPRNAISVVETDCILDFEEPLDYKQLLQQEEEERRRKLTAAAANKEKGCHKRAINQDTDTDTTRFKAFSGASRRLG